MKVMTSGAFYCSAECLPVREPKPKPTVARLTPNELEQSWRKQWSPLRAARESGDHVAVIEQIRAASAEVGGCWIWQRRIKDGYPIVRIGSRTMSAHRVVLEAKCGADLGSQAAHHICAESRCVNPDHLQPVTHRENVAEMLARHSYLARIRELEEALGVLAPSHPLLAVVAVA